MPNEFDSPFVYTLIYIFEIPGKSHEGSLKIGRATIKTRDSIDNLPPNCESLNKEANKRIDQYTRTAGIRYNLLHTELAIRTVKLEDGGAELRQFGDHDVHKVLLNSGIKKKTFDNSTGREWFEVDLNTAKKAIEAVKCGEYNLSGTSIEEFTPIVFREEQSEAIEKALKQFKNSNKMLWNAKMRFGKTLSALEVVRRAKFKHTIIITHRPVVDSGWYEDFKKIFYDNKDYVYGSKNSGCTIKRLLKSEKNFVYFTSMQNLRGSDAVGGKFDKNEDIFSFDWDLVIVDEAHEGTTTALGDDVIKKIVKEDSGYPTKFLALSGTPFNILRDYEAKNIYTWDYIMEQERKAHWEELHFGDSNPYSGLPELKIYTYNLGELITNKEYTELEDKAFNFREFFRVWTGDIASDMSDIPEGQEVGDFCHEKDVKSFLNLITREDKKSNHPYATKEYRELFKHTLWMLPGVKEARAFSKLLKSHPVFGCGQFNIVNVAGDGDKEDEEAGDALQKVRDAIDQADKVDEYTITLSCGRLTTGVTVPEWTAVFMLSGSFSTSAANYLQTIFRVQSPCSKYGKIKQCCYVFDFAPDRTLKMVAESVAISTKAGKTGDNDRTILGKFLNYCPVISIEGTEMRKYDTDKLLQQLKRAYAEGAVQNGFDDPKIYNDELLKLDGMALEDFKELKGIIGASKAQPKTNEIDINTQGFTNEEYEELKGIERKPKCERTPEEQAKLEEAKEKNKKRRDAISILRGISIRMPLLIYGVNIDFDKDVTLENLTALVDDSSWNEFMPTGVTKEFFKKFTRYYDQEIFIVAGRKIRNIARSADELPPTRRVQKIAELFSCFKNPDKETVLTPWRVVNMHLSDCLGGYDFYDVTHNSQIEEPRFVDQGKVTDETLANTNAQILEINSKTGLYPLYVAYSIYRSKCSAYGKTELTHEDQEKLWADTVRDNIFVICKTPMAKSITKRTLVGFKELTVNTHCFEDLINMIKNNRQDFINDVLNPSNWEKEGIGKMKFDAVVGNPPYQESGGSGGTSDSPIYQYFVEAALETNASYTSLITPSRWYAGGRENLLGDFREKMLNNRTVKKLITYDDSHDVFPSVEIKGGLCIYLTDISYNGDCEYILISGNSKDVCMRNLSEFNIFIKYPILSMIIKKVEKINKNLSTVDTIISNDTPFGISTNPKESTKKPIKIFDTSAENHNTKIYYIDKSKRKMKYISKEIITKNIDMIEREKVFIPSGYGAGEAFPHQILGIPEYAGANSVCSQSYLYASFSKEVEAKNFVIYLSTKFFRVLVLSMKITQSAPKKVYRFVPLQDFTPSSDINWSKSVSEIDKQLYRKYGLTDEEIAFIEEKIKPMQ